MIVEKHILLRNREGEKFRKQVIGIAFRMRCNDASDGACGFPVRLGKW